MLENSPHNKISIIFFGSPEFALPSLRSLHNSDRINITAIVSQPEKERGRGKKVRPTPVSEFAKEHNITLFEPISLRKADWRSLTPKENADLELIRFLEFIKLEGPPDLSIVVAYGKLIPEDLICIAKHDFLNVHPSSLPRWRGSAPLQKTLISGDKESSVCIMRLTKGLDEGPIYLEENFTVPEDETLKELHDRTSLLGAELLLKTILEIKDKGIKPREQGEEGVLYADKLLTKDTVIDWTKSSQEIHNLIRGLSPHPGAQTKLEIKIVKIIKSKSLNLDLKKGPGDISIDKKNKQILVACGSGTALEVLQLKPEGKGVINASDFINGLKESENLRFQIS